MEMNYVFMTDSDSDLLYSIADEKHIPVVRMSYTLEGKEYLDDNGRSGVETDFFSKMRAGANPNTSLLPTEVYLEYFEPVLKEKDLLFVAFSSQMSSTINNIYEAREILLAKYPERKFIVVDTLSISGPQTLLILGAHALYEQGKSMEEVEKWLLDNRLRAHAWLTVGDLKYLARGGRISSTSALFGSVLDIKPIICMGKGGKLDPVEKVQGRKKALRTIVERTAENIEHPEEQTVIILQGDVPDEAERLAEMLRARIPEIKEIRIQIIGPVIGAHCGPGTLACCFMGKERTI
ncbi:MAG: DegV family protein [Clostridiales bacterium]|nr:DegV family protein [Clostridiales bacterium]